MVVVEPIPEPKARRYRRRSNWLTVVPTLLIPWIVYNAVAATGVELDHRLFEITLPSAAPPWGFTVSDAVLLLSLMLLFFEILKSTRTGGNSVADHALSMIVAGFSVTIRAARRDYSVGGDQ
jgi:hypothetical protein